MATPKVKNLEQETVNKPAPWSACLKLDQGYQFPISGKGMDGSFLTDFTLAADKEIFKLPGKGGSFKFDAGIWTRIPAIDPSSYNMRIWSSIGYYSKDALNLFIIPRFYSGWDGGSSGLIIPTVIAGISPQFTKYFGLETSFGLFYHDFFPKKNNNTQEPPEEPATSTTEPLESGLVTIASLTPYLTFDDFSVRASLQWWMIDMNNNEPIHLIMPFVGSSWVF